MSTSQIRKPGFSLVEMVIVVVIIATMAAIAVPRISRASKRASEAALRGNLHAMRNAIDLYAAEHSGTWPGADGLNVTFWAQLTEQTDVDGNVGTVPGVHVYGPYLRDRIPVPVGPNPGVRGVRNRTDNPISLGIDESKTNKGWVFNYETGTLIPNTDDLDDEGVGYDTY